MLRRIFYTISDFIKDYPGQIAGATVMALCALTVFSSMDSQTASSDGVSSLYVGHPPKLPTHSLNILFVGNSYTFYQDMPKMLADIVASDPGSALELHVKSVTHGGVGLKEMWQEKTAADAIRETKWDYVVLQDQSFWAMSDASVRVSYDHFSRFDQLVRQTGARSILYLTWERQPGSSWYTDPKYASLLQSPDHMQDMFTYYTHTVGANLGIAVADVGEYWRVALKSDPKTPLYFTDGHHPSKAGAYLTALVFYKMFTGHNVQGVTYVPSGVDPALAAKLRAIAAAPLPAAQPAQAQAQPAAVQPAAAQPAR